MRRGATWAVCATGAAWAVSGDFRRPMDRRQREEICHLRRHAGWDDAIRRQKADQLRQPRNRARVDDGGLPEAEAARDPAERACAEHLFDLRAGQAERRSNGRPQDATSEESPAVLNRFKKPPMPPCAPVINVRTSRTSGAAFAPSPNLCAISSISELEDCHVAYSQSSFGACGGEWQNSKASAWRVKKIRIRVNCGTRGGSLVSSGASPSIRRGNCQSRGPLLAP